LAISSAKYIIYCGSSHDFCSTVILTVASHTFLATWLVAWDMYSSIGYGTSKGKEREKKQTSWNRWMNSILHVNLIIMYIHTIQHAI